MPCVRKLLFRLPVTLTEKIKQPNTQTSKQPIKTKQTKQNKKKKKEKKHQFLFRIVLYSTFAMLRHPLENLSFTYTANGKRQIQIEKFPK